MPASHYTPPSPPIYDSHGFHPDPRFDLSIGTTFDELPQHHSGQRSSPPAINIMWGDQASLMTDARRGVYPGLSLDKSLHSSGPAGVAGSPAFLNNIGGHTDQFAATTRLLRNTNDGALFDSPCSTPSLCGSERNIGADFSLHQHNWSAESLGPEEAPTFPPRQALKTKEDRHHIPPAVQATAPPPLPPRKVTGACQRCRRLKMRCEFKEGAYSCSRCTTGRHECKLEERKPKTQGQREILLNKMTKCTQELDAAVDKARQEAPNYTPITFAQHRLPLSAAQRETFKSVLANASAKTSKPPPAQLEEVRAILENEDWSGTDSSSESSEDSASRNSPFGDSHELPNRRAPIGIMAELSLSQQGGPTYFQPGPLSNHHLRQILIERGDEAPQILLHGLITSAEEVELLFDIFFKRIQPIVAVLDENIHTPSAVLLRSPFLFTVICAIASRFLRLEPGRQHQEDIYPLAIHYAKTAAASAILDGRKNVETIQAFLLLGLYAPGAKHIEDSRTWSFSGIARMLAPELNLHAIPHKPASTDERTVREWNNKIRTWMVCFNVDRTLASQYGKPCLLEEDYHIRNLSWYKSPFTNPYDLHLQAHTALLSIMKRFHETINAAPESEPAENLIKIIEKFDRELSVFETDLNAKYQNESDSSDEGCRFRASLNPLTINYSRLVVLSRLLEKNFDKKAAPKDLILKAIVASTTVINVFTGPLLQSKQLPYAPDCYFVYSGFAATFLLKLIDPRSSLLVEDQEQRECITQRAEKLVKVLRSLSLDDTHAAGVYAQLISSTLSNVTKHAPTFSPSSELAALAGSPSLSVTSMPSVSSTDVTTGSSLHTLSEFDFQPDAFKVESMSADAFLIPSVTDSFDGASDPAMWNDFLPSPQQNTNPWSTYNMGDSWAHQGVSHYSGHNQFQSPTHLDFYSFEASQPQSQYSF